MTDGTGTRDDPWALTTAPGSSQYTMYREEGDPPALVCQVGSTTLRYHLRAIENLHAWLREQGDWRARDLSFGAGRAPREVLPMMSADTADFAGSVPSAWTLPTKSAGAGNVPRHDRQPLGR